MSPAEVPVSPVSSRQVDLTIITWDTTTGAPVQELCLTSRDRGASDVLVVDVQHLRDVEAARCQSG
jgi:hypothetical protein